MENSWGNSVLDPNTKDNLKESKLTTREKEILFHIANGETNKGISEALALSTSTVKNHISNIFIKLKISNRAQATSFAIRSNLFNQNPGLRTEKWN